AMLVPMLRSRGYDMNQATRLIAAGRIIAPIIPPSISFIIFGVAANVSVTKLFMAGTVPGLSVGLTLVLVWACVSAKSKTMQSPPKEPWPIRAKAMKESGWALMLPIIIIGGLRGGIFTPTEAAAVAAVYALFVGMVIYKEITI